MRVPLLQLQVGDVVEMGKRAVGTRIPDLRLLRNGRPIGVLEVFVQQPCSDETWTSRATLGIPVVEVQTDDILALRDAEGWSAPLPIPVRRALVLQDALCPNCVAWRSRPKPKPQEPARIAPTKVPQERRPPLQAKQSDENHVLPFKRDSALFDRRVPPPRVKQLERLCVDIYSRGGVLTELCIVLDQLEQRGVMTGELRLGSRKEGAAQHDRLLANWDSDVARDPEKLRAEARKVLADWKKSFTAELTWHIEWWTKSTSSTRKVWAWNGSEWRRVYGTEVYERVERLVRQLQAPYPRRIMDKARDGGWLDAEDVDALEARAKDAVL
ncbi:hypothetical protein [Archangium sp. Cb G35]|uniref:hypothetical protein n=1 Tax=Archangium sp. Cb G35 TaxID=1920190 RepID=UPI001E4D761B|nr:hypothetical protein [Archangium sp. Cb G35]